MTAGSEPRGGGQPDRSSPTQAPWRRYILPSGGAGIAALTALGVVAALPPEPEPVPVSTAASVPMPLPPKARTAAANPIEVSPDPVPAMLRLEALLRFEAMPPPAAGSDATDTRPVWQQNAVHVALLDGRPLIAIVIDDMGLDQSRSARAVGLPGPLTMAFLPYGRDLPQQARAAHAAGHELIVHMPMEPDDHGYDPGPGALRSDLTAPEVLSRLDNALAQFDGYVGVNNHMGSHFSADRAGMAVVLQQMAERGLLYLDSRTTVATVAPELASELGVALVERDIFLDNDRTDAAVRAALGALEAKAREQGYAIGIGHPHDVTLDVLSDWLPEVVERGFQLVPISAIGRTKVDQPLRAAN